MGERDMPSDASVADDYTADYTCPSSSHLFKSNMDFAHHVRSPLKNMVQQLCPKPHHQYVLFTQQCAKFHYIMWVQDNFRIR